MFSFSNDKFVFSYHLVWKVFLSTLWGVFWVFFGWWFNLGFLRNSFFIAFCARGGVVQSAPRNSLDQKPFFVSRSRLNLCKFEWAKFFFCLRESSEKWRFSEKERINDGIYRSVWDDVTAGKFRETATFLHEWGIRFSFSRFDEEFLRNM